jgi:uroporphyrin-3 C-methyltransferase
VDAPSSPVPPTPRTRSLAGGLLLAVLCLLLVAAAGWFGWREWQSQRAAVDAQAREQRQALELRIDALRKAQQAQALRLQQAEATNRVLRDELLGIGQRAALLEDSLSRLADPDRHGAQSLRLDEIELLLGIGQQRLRLAGDMDGARRALALAAPLLDGIDDPAYLNLRQTLAQERAATEALGADPRVRANALLDALMARLASAEAQPAKASVRAPWYQRLLGRIVQVEPTAGAGLRQRPDREVALVALEVEASLARAAIERRDDTALAASVARIDAGLRRLLAGSPLLAGKRRIAAELRALPLRADSPLSGTTLQQLRALRGQ